MTHTMQLSPLKACLVDYMLQRGLPLKKAFHCLSPLHEDRHPSMSYNPRGNNVHCFSCGVTYDIFDLVGMDYGIDDFPERYAKACELFGFEPTKLESKREARPVIIMAEPPYVISDPPRGEISDRSGELETLRRRSSGDISYFSGRGITAESCSKYGLFQVDDRAYFPVTEDDVCVGWCARLINDDGEAPRYKNSVGQMSLWNSDYLAENGNIKRIFITEGIIDAICLEQLGEKAVALCGSQNTDKLLSRVRDLMKSLPRDVNAEAVRESAACRFVLCGDPDIAGKKMNAALKDGLKKLGFECEILPLEEEDGDIGGLYQRDRQRLVRLVGEIGCQLEKESLEYLATSAAAGLDAFFAESEKRARQGAISTGFASLDKLLDGGLYSGLYVIGAISSLGKTSFALQIADYIAESREDVLFMSLEQSRFELMAKSLSRTSARLDGARKKNAFTARQLLSGQAESDLYRQKLLCATREIYARAASRLYIREGVAEIGVAEIRDAVREHQKRRGRAPVVVVDYLQILRPFDGRATDKQNIDRAVVELKRLSRDFDIPVITISSFNRENYRAAVSMEAFKESGAVEYSSDVLFGLQLKGAGQKDFDVNKAKSQDPKRLELVMLKNRNGIPYAKVELEYLAKFSLFEEAGRGIVSVNY